MNELKKQVLDLWNRYKPTIAVDAIEYDMELRRLLSTNLAEVGTDCISRQQAIKATWQDTGYTDPLNVMTAIRDRIMQLPPIQPDNGLQRLADEIAKFKRHLKSENSDYLTGYLCALSAVEGMIADMREVTE